MAVSKPDLIEGARIVERNGVVAELDRVYYLSDLTTSNASGRIKEALDACPATGSVHPDYDGSMGAEKTTLMLEDRVGVAHSDKTGRVTLTYRWNPTVLTFVSGTAGVESVVTSKVSPSETAAPIKLQHPSLPEDLTGTKQQGALVNVTAARFTAVGIITSSLTDGDQQAMRHLARWMNTINDDAFLGGTAHQWLIVDGDYDAVARDANGKVTKARFTWTFQKKEEGYNPIEVVAIRPSDGLPFPDVDDAGASGASVDINWYEERTFSDIVTVGP